MARGLGIGLLAEDEVPSNIIEMLADSITYYREHYEIDDDDPLSELRG